MKALVTPIGVLYILSGIGSGVIAALLFVYAMFPALIGVAAANGAAKGENGAFEAMVMMLGTTFGVGAFAVVAGVLALLYLVDGVGLILRKGWARWLALVLAVPLFGACLPFGLIVGVLAFITMLMPDTAEEFAGASEPT